MRILLRTSQPACAKYKISNYTSYLKLFRHFLGWKWRMIIHVMWREKTDYFMIILNWTAISNNETFLCTFLEYSFNSFCILIIVLYRWRWGCSTKKIIREIRASSCTTNGMLMHQIWAHRHRRWTSICFRREMALKSMTRHGKPWARHLLDPFLIQLVYTLAAGILTSCGKVVEFGRQQKITREGMLGRSCFFRKMPPKIENEAQECATAMSSAFQPTIAFQFSGTL